MSETEKKDICDCLTEEEREKLVSSLHHALVWVGIKEPEELEIDKSELKVEMQRYNQTEKDLPPELHASQGRILLHNLIWRLINEKDITETEKQQISEIVDLLERKEKIDENSLISKRLTQEEAEKLHDEAAGIIRSLLELRDLLRGRGHGADSRSEREEIIRQKVDEAKRWNNFIDRLKDKGGTSSS